VVGRVQIVVVDEVRSVGVNESIEPKSITPARRKILNFHTFVPVITKAPTLEILTFNTYFLHHFFVQGCLADSKN